MEEIYNTIHLKDNSPEEVGKYLFRRTVELATEWVAIADFVGLPRKKMVKMMLKAIKVVSNDLARNKHVRIQTMGIDTEELAKQMGEMNDD